MGKELNLRQAEFVEIVNFKKVHDLGIIPKRLQKPFTQMNDEGKVSIFSGVTDTQGKPVFLSEVLDDIKNGKWAKQISELRSIKDEETQKDFKNTLPGFTASGVFKKRSIEGLLSHSGALIIDIDRKDNPILSEKFDETRKNLIKDKYTSFLFNSCRGNGFALGVRIDGEKHGETFQYLEHYYRECHGLVIDRGCRDISRLRFISHDPDLYSNEGAENVIVPPDFLKEQKCSHSPVSHANEKNREIVKAITISGILLGDDTYESWVRIALALAQEFGETGREYSHSLSRISPKYDSADCDRKYDNCLKTNRGEVTFATIVHMAKEAGIVWTKTPSNGETVSLPLVNQPKVFNCTDWGNAKRLVLQHGDVVRYCFAWKKWLVWDGKTWCVDDNGQIVRLAKATVKRIYAETAVFIDSEERKTIAKWAIKSEEETKLKSMVSLAKSEDGVPISPKELDVDPYLLNCLNGTIDLRTGQLTQHNPRNFITKNIPVSYDPAAQCPQWIEFLEKIMNWNYDLIRFLQRAVGYSLTGDTSEQCLFLLHGCGANGKSTFLNIVSFLLGDFAQTATFDTFLAKKEERVNNDIARMQGKRFVSAIESEDGRRISEVIIKSMTGGDRLTARFLFGEFFEFTPQFKIFLAANHKPNIRGTDHGIWRRIKLIPFAVIIPEDQRDPKLPEKLKSELPGILAWAVQGCLEWQKNGLQTPTEVKTATQGYREEMDCIGVFLSECCILTSEVRTKSGDLYEAYKKWCEDNGEYTIGNRHFGRRLSEKGFQSQQSNGNWWKGIGIKV